MNRLRDSSEIQETIRLLNELVVQSAVVAPIIPDRPPSPPTGQTIVSVKRAPEPSPPKETYRGDRLDGVLFSMCKRGGFDSAVIADGSGLPLAVYNSPVGDDAVAAFTTVLGDALEKAGKLLDQHDANNISMDINYTDKAVLRRFLINDLPYYVMIICPQEVDERSEVELSTDEIISILKQV